MSKKGGSPVEWVCGCCAVQRPSLRESSLLKKARMGVSSLLGLGLVGALAGPWAPAAAAPGQVCYFGECSASTAPAAPSQSKARLLSKYGSWSAVLIGQGAMSVDEVSNG